MMSSTDIWFSSFLIMNGHEVSSYEIRERNKGVFFFNISRDEWMKLKLEFNRSDARKIKAAYTSLRDLLH